MLAVILLVVVLVSHDAITFLTFWALDADPKTKFAGREVILHIYDKGVQDKQRFELRDLIICEKFRELNHIYYF